MSKNSTEFDHSKFKSLVLGRGIKLSWLSIQVGVTPKGMSSILNGRSKPSLPVVKLLCRILDVEESEYVQVKAS